MGKPHSVYRIEDVTPLPLSASDLIPIESHKEDDMSATNEDRDPDDGIPCMYCSTPV